MRAAALLLALAMIASGCLSGQEAPAPGGDEPIDPAGNESEDGQEPAGSQDDAGDDGSNDTSPGDDSPEDNETGEDPPEPPSRAAYPSDEDVRALYIEFLRNGTVDVQASGEVFTLGLESSDLIVPDAFWETDGEPVQAPWLAVTEGQVQGQDGTEARLVFADTWIGGVVLAGTSTYLVQNDGGTLHAVLDDATRLPSGSPFAMRGGQAPNLTPETFDDSDVNCLHPAPVPASPVLPLVSDPGTITVDIILDTDATVAERFEQHPKALAVMWTAMADAIYDEQLNMRFNIVGVHSATQNNSYGGDDPLGQLSDHWNQRDDDRDLVHLFTARDLTTAQANCIGGAGDPNIAYTYTDLTWTPRGHLTAVVHEIGHIFSAHHHLSNCAESVVLCTMMINAVDLNVKTMFSSANKASIRGWAEQHVAG